MASDEKPVPKSSMAIETPSARSASKVSRTPSTSSIRADSVSSSVSRSGGSPVRSSAPATVPHEVGRAELDGRDVDGDREVPERHRVGARALEHPGAERHDQAGGLGDGDEVGGRHRLAARLVRQRSSVSTPLVAPDSTSTIGW